MTIPIALPSLGRLEAEAAQKVILSGWVTQGPKVLEFENLFAKIMASPHACAVSSCTTALHLALKAVGVQPGDIVLTPSHTFIATANAIRYCNAEPWFIDIDPLTRNISPTKIEEFLHQECHENYHIKSLKKFSPLTESPINQVKHPKGRIAAILAVHQIGLPADLTSLRQISNRTNIPLVEDAACAIGSQYKIDNTWLPIGHPHSSIACFSFHPRKVLTTGDGGMLSTNNPTYDQNFRLWRQHGMSVSDLSRHNTSPSQLENYLTTGFNYRMTDIQAAIGVVQLGRLNEIIQQRRQLAANYLNWLKEISAIQLPYQPDDCQTNYQTFMIRLPDHTSSQRDHIMTLLHQQGIATRPGILCCHRCPPYQDAWHDEELPASSQARDTDMALPLYHGLTQEDQLRVVEALQKAVG